MQPQIKSTIIKTHILAHTRTSCVHALCFIYLFLNAIHKMQSSHSDGCSFVILYFVNDIYFSVSFICVLLCSERKITLTDK